MTSLTLPLYRGLPPGLSITDSVDFDDEYSSLSVSAATGLLYKTFASSDGARNSVLTFGADGRPHPLAPALSKLSGNGAISAVMACSMPSGPAVVVASEQLDEFVVSAFSECNSSVYTEAVGELLWKTEFSGGSTCSGIAALPDHGVIVVGHSDASPSGAIYVLDMESGMVRASLPAHYAFYISADDLNGTVFASMKLQPGEGPFHSSFSVAMFEWNGEVLLSKVRRSVS